MKKFLIALTSPLVTVIASYLIWLAFRFIAPMYILWVVEESWYWLLLFGSVEVVVIYGLVNALCGVFTLLIMNLQGGYGFFKWINAFIFAAMGWSAVILPFELNIVASGTWYWVGVVTYIAGAGLTFAAPTFVMLLPSEKKQQIKSAN